MPEQNAPRARSLTPEEALRTTPAEGFTAIARTLASVIPLVGGPAAELINAAIMPNLSRRRDRFLTELYDGLKSLEERVQGLSIESLAEDEQFVSVVVRATQAALSNHRQEKREALRNAVLNTAAGTPLTEDEQLMFVQLVDRLTPSHLTVLDFFRDPPAWRMRRRLPPPTVAGPGPSHRAAFEQVMPGFTDPMRGETWKQVCRDLTENGLAPLSLQQITAMLNDGGVDDPHITRRGTAFLDYITSPLGGT